MTTITLRIIRTGSFLSRIMPYEVWFRDIKLTSKLTDNASDFTIDSIKGVLKVRELGSKFAFHIIEKSVIIFPEYIKSADNVILCELDAKLYWLGVLTFGFLAPVRNININIKY